MSSSTPYFLVNSKACLGTKTGNLKNFFSAFFNYGHSVCVQRAPYKSLEKLLLELLSDVSTWGDFTVKSFLKWNIL